MIRFAQITDLPAILEIYAPYVQNTCYSFEYTVPTREEFARRFAHHTAYCPWLVWEEDDTVLGYAYGAPAFERAAYRWCAEVSVYLVPQAQGKGVGRRLYDALETILFGQGYRVIYAIITSENEGSVKFHEAMGYRHVATFPGCGIKFGRELGTVWMEKRSKCDEIPTNTPMTWREIVDNDEKIKNILDTLSIS